MNRVSAPPLVAAAACRGPLAPEYVALQHLVGQAARGEIVFDPTAAPTADPRPGLNDAGALDDDDPEMPSKLPAGWYVKADVAGQKSLRPEVRAALLGLLAGVAVLLPVSYWLSGASTETALPPESVLAVRAQELVADVRNRALAIAEVQAAALPDSGLSLLVPMADVEFDEAVRLISVGEVIAARTLLATAATATSPDALFLLAETYDPNMLAAWGTRGVQPDPTRARALYAAANALGHTKADVRLDSLK
jgi:hypothetical protein